MIKLCDTLSKTSQSRFSTLVAPIRSMAYSTRCMSSKSPNMPMDSHELYNGDEQYSSYSHTQNIFTLFPGQGSQKIGMSKDILEEFLIAQHTMEEIEYGIGQNLRRIMFDGPQNELNYTFNAQPAVFAHSMCIQQILKNECELDKEIGGVAGHSVGEYAALATANVCEMHHLAALLKLRGISMQFSALLACATEEAILALKQNDSICSSAFEQCLTYDISDLIGMSAVFPTNVKNANDACVYAQSKHPNSVVQVANMNSPAQVVLSGHKEAVETAIDWLKQHRYARRSIALSVSAPFHCDIMGLAAVGMQSIFKSLLPSDTSLISTDGQLDLPQIFPVPTREQFVEKLVNCRYAEHVQNLNEFRSATVPFYNNLDGKALIKPDDIISSLCKSIIAPVQWTECINEMYGPYTAEPIQTVVNTPKMSKSKEVSSVPCFLELGGNTVGKFVSQTLKESGSHVVSLNNVEDMKSFIRAMNQYGDAASAIQHLATSK